MFKERVKAFAMVVVGLMLSTLIISAAFVAVVWMTITTVAEILAQRGVKLFIHPSHNVPGDTTAHDRLDAALVEYKRRVAGV